MFTLLARLTTKRPLLVVLALCAVMVAALSSSAGLSDRLSTQGFTPPHSESSHALDQLAAANGADARAQIVALVTPGGQVDSPRGRELVKKTKRLLDADQDMKFVRSPFEHGRVHTALISKDGTRAIVIGNLIDGRSGKGAPERLQAAFADTPQVELGGWEMAQHAVSATIETDLRRAEMIAFPLIFVIALFVFRGLIAALLPVLVGGIAIPVSFALLRLADSITDLSVFALNLTSGMALGLAIDYSLLLVTRYREEIAAGADGTTAITRTLATAGRTVTFSSITVAGATAALGLFPLKFLYSMGIGGVIVAVVSASVALTLLPAVLMLLGPRIDKLALPRRSAEHSIATWRRHAQRMMRHALPVAVGTTAVLLLLALPALHIRFTSVDASVLKHGASPRVVQQQIDHAFPRSDANASMWVAVRSPSLNAEAVARDARRLRGDVARSKRKAAALARDQRALQIATLTRAADPATLKRRADALTRRAKKLKRESNRLSRRGDRIDNSANRVDDFESRIDAYRRQISQLRNVDDVGKAVVIGDGTWTFDIYPKAKRYDDATRATVAQVRALQAPASRWVGGSSASFVDQRHVLGSRLAATLALIGVITFVALFLMTGSVVLPVKTFIMNLATLAATFGILVWVFQDNRFESLLSYEGQGALEMTQPVLLFAIAFGLATDYGVFLLSRIKEFHDAGERNSDAVADGVAHTGRVISSAAVLFCAAIITFSTSGIVFVKELGIGLALAVAIDSSIVRAMLVPALMQLLGAYNWWAPSPLRRLHARIGWSEGPSAPAPLLATLPPPIAEPAPRAAAPPPRPAPKLPPPPPREPIIVGAVPAGEADRERRDERSVVMVAVSGFLAALVVLAAIVRGLRSA